MVVRAEASHRAFHAFCDRESELGLDVLRNLVASVAAKTRSSNASTVDRVIAHHSERAVCEELTAGAWQTGGIHPLEVRTVIKDPEAFLLSGPARLLHDGSAGEDRATREEIDIAVFADPARRACIAWRSSSIRRTSPPPPRTGRAGAVAARRS